ncbi:MAG: hypothetical protein JNN08_12250 [Bryobacterales bacterium]|nr:hypothetical protein [Bryobacterales bacterium]
MTLFRHADVVAAATDPITFSSAVSAHRMVPNSLNPPEHTAFRAVVDGFFTVGRMAASTHPPALIPRSFTRATANSSRRTA